MKKAKTVSFKTPTSIVPAQKSWWAGLKPQHVLSLKI